MSTPYTVRSFNYRSDDNIKECIHGFIHLVMGWEYIPGYHPTSMWDMCRALRWLIEAQLKERIDPININQLLLLAKDMEVKWQKHDKLGPVMFIRIAHNRGICTWGIPYSWPKYTNEQQKIILLYREHLASEEVSQYINNNNTSPIMSAA